MATSLAVGTFADGLYQGSPPRFDRNGMAIRQRCEQLRGELETERASFLSHWKDLADYILPRRARFTLTDVNKGDRRNQKIIDSTATESVGITSAGMMSGVTSPARPWFRLTLSDAALSEVEEVQYWLHEVQNRMETVFLRSNLYNKLPILYQDLAVFGTGSMGVFEDDESVIRLYDFPVGSYSMANDYKLRVRTFVRPFRLMVSQVVEQFGHPDPRTGNPDFVDGRPSSISQSVQGLWKRGGSGKATWVDLVHVIQPNVEWDGTKTERQFLPFEDIYYELGTSGDPRGKETGLLQHGGFEEFPVLCARWETNSEDVYGTNCPGMRALGDIKQLQTTEKRIAQAIEKTINPPLTGPASLMNKKVSVLPGDVTYDDPRDAGLGIRPIYQTTFRINDAEAKQEQLRLRIRRVFKEDLFLMLANSDRREITAREVDERHEEKLLALGPVLEQLNQDVLDPLIDRTFNIMWRKGLIPEPPEEIQGAALRVEYVSVMAQAQKMIQNAGIERFAGFAAQLAQTMPAVLDRINPDELIEEYAEGNGIPPKILRPQEEVDAMRQERAQQAAQQQAAENIPAIAGAAKDLSQSPTGGDTALSRFLAASQARRTIGATAGPPTGPI